MQCAYWLPDSCVLPRMHDCYAVSIWKRLYLRAYACSSPHWMYGKLSCVPLHRRRARSLLRIWRLRHCTYSLLRIWRLRHCTYSLLRMWRLRHCTYSLLRIWRLRHCTYSLLRASPRLVLRPWHQPHVGNRATALRVAAERGAVTGSHTSEHPRSRMEWFIQQGPRGKPPRWPGFGPNTPRCPVGSWDNRVNQSGSEPALASSSSDLSALITN